MGKRKVSKRAEDLVDFKHLVQASKADNQREADSVEHKLQELELEVSSNVAKHPTYFAVRIKQYADILAKHHIAKSKDLQRRLDSAEYKIKELQHETDSLKDLSNELGLQLGVNESPTCAKMKDALNRIVHAHDEHIKLQDKSWSEALAWAQDIAQKALE